MKKNKPLSDGMIAALFVVYALLFFGGICAGFKLGKDVGSDERAEMEKEVYELMDDNLTLLSDGKKCDDQLKTCVSVVNELVKFYAPDGGAVE